MKRGHTVAEYREKIRALREKAEKALGPRFDLRLFHDTLIGSGAVPLDVLEEMVNNWVGSRK